MPSPIIIGGRRGISSSLGLTTDPLAGLTFALRLQTHSGFGATPNAPVGLYTDVLCTTPATMAGDLVAAWRDELGTSRLTATQATSGKRPILQFVSSKPVLRFNGTSSSMGFVLTFASTSHIWYSGLSQGTSMGRILTDTGLGRLILYPYADAGGGLVGYYDGAAFRSIAVGTTAFQVLTYKFAASGTTGTAYRNGTSLGTATYNPVPVGVGSAIGAVYTDQNAGFFDGDLSSLLVQSTLPTTQQQQTVEGYLATI